jgi:hypothetical protein
MVCELCERDVERLTSHHLIPKLKGGKNGSQARLCPTCHRQVHALYSEGTLAKRLNSIPLLKADPQVANYVSWMQRQTASANFRVRRSRGRY